MDLFKLPKNWNFVLCYPIDCYLITSSSSELLQKASCPSGASAIFFLSLVMCTQMIMCPQKILVVHTRALQKYLMVIRSSVGGWFYRAKRWEQHICSFLAENVASISVTIIASVKTKLPVLMNVLGSMMEFRA